jgi:hypothetical protein
MPKCYFLSTHSGEGPRNNGPAYATVEDALAAASELVNEGAKAVRILDDEGNLILPPDQVRLRLNPSAAHAAKGPARHI